MRKNKVQLHFFSVWVSELTNLGPNFGSCTTFFFIIFQNKIQSSVVSNMFGPEKKKCDFFRGHQGAWCAKIICKGLIWGCARGQKFKMPEWVSRGSNKQILHGGTVVFMGGAGTFSIGRGGGYLHSGHRADIPDSANQHEIWPYSGKKQLLSDFGARYRTPPRRKKKPSTAPTSGPLTQRVACLMTNKSASLNDKTMNDKKIFSSLGPNFDTDARTVGARYGPHADPDSNKKKSKSKPADRG